MKLFARFKRWHDACLTPVTEMSTAEIEQRIKMAYLVGYTAGRRTMYKAARKKDKQRRIENKIKKELADQL